MLLIRVGRHAQRGISSYRTVIDQAAASCQVVTAQSACACSGAMLAGRPIFSAAPQAADAAAGPVQPARQPCLQSQSPTQPQIASVLRRGFAKGAAKAKREKNRQAAPERTRQEPHKRHAPATPEGSLVDFTEEELHMEAALDHLKQELGSMRTGRASPGMLDHIRVEAYDERMPLHTLATVLARDAQLLVASVYDPATLPAVEKAISASPLGLNPRIDGQDILIPVPRPSPEVQEAMSKLCKREVEACKVSVRNARHSGLQSLKDIASEDERFRAETELQKLTDKHIQLAEQLGADKAKEIKTV